MKKWLSALIAASLAVSLLVGCGQKEEPSKNADATNVGTAKTEETKKEESKVKGKISVAVHRDTPGYIEKYKTYIVAFKKKYPEVTEVELQPLSGDKYKDLMKVRLASNELPDVHYGVAETKEQWKEYYTDLSVLGLDDKLQLTKETIDECGGLYKITFGVGLDGVIYSKKVFADSGVTVPRNFDELKAACEMLKAKGITPIATCAKDGWPMLWFMKAIPILEGDYLYFEKMHKEDSVFSPNKPYGKMFTIVKEFADKGYFEKDLSSATFEQSKKDIVQGKTAMIFMGSWYLADLETAGANMDDIGFFPYPFSSGKATGILSSDWGYSVPKSSENIDTALAYVKFLLEETDAAELIGFMPTLKEKKTSSPQLEEFMSFNPEIFPRHEWTDEGRNIFNKAQIDQGQLFVEVAASKKDVKDISDKWNKAWLDAKKALGY